MIFIILLLSANEGRFEGGFKKVFAESTLYSRKFYEEGDFFFDKWFIVLLINVLPQNVDD